jgi:hypothetical protein
VVGVRTTGVRAFAFLEELIFPEGATVGSSGSIVSSKGVDTFIVGELVGGSGNVVTSGHHVTSLQRCRAQQWQIK